METIPNLKKKIVFEDTSDALKIRTKHSAKALLSLVQILMHHTLYEEIQ